MDYNRLLYLDGSDYIVHDVFETALCHRCDDWSLVIHCQLSAVLQKKLDSPPRPVSLAGEIHSNRSQTSILNFLTSLTTFIGLLSKIPQTKLSCGIFN